MVSAVDVLRSTLISTVKTCPTLTLLAPGFKLNTGGQAPVIAWMNSV